MDLDRISRNHFVFLVCFLKDTFAFFHLRSFLGSSLLGLFFLSRFLFSLFLFFFRHANCFALFFHRWTWLNEWSTWRAIAFDDDQRWRGI